MAIKWLKKRKDIDLDGFKTFMSIYLENEISFDLIRRLFLSFVKRFEKKSEPTIDSQQQSSTHGINLNSSSCNQHHPPHHHHNHHSHTITEAFHSIGARFNFPSFGTTATIPVNNITNEIDEFDRNNNNDGENCSQTQPQLLPPSSSSILSDPDCSISTNKLSNCLVI